METILIELRRYTLARHHAQSSCLLCDQIYGSSAAQEAASASRGHLFLKESYPCSRDMCLHMTSIPDDGKTREMPGRMKKGDQEVDSS
jgi:hypothetical protein